MTRFVTILVGLSVLPAPVFGQTPATSHLVQDLIEPSSSIPQQELEKRHTVPETKARPAEPGIPGAGDRVLDAIKRSNVRSVGAFGVRQLSTRPYQSVGSQAVAPISQHEFQQRFAVAQRSIDGGKKKMLYGAAIGAGAFVIAMVGGGSCSDLECGTGAQTFGMLGLLGGMGYATWGYFQYADGKSEITLLELQRAAAARGGGLRFSHTVNW